MPIESIPLKGVFLPEKPLPMLISSFIVGIVLSLCLDIFSGKRISGSNSAIRFFTDLVSVLLSYFIEFLCALNFNNGIIRWYHIAVLVVAVLLYKKFLSVYVVSTFDLVYIAVTKIIKLIIRCITFLLKTIVSPFFAIYKRASVVITKKCDENNYNKYKKAYISLACAGFYLADINKK